MACITISGFPCSGKTTRSLELKKHIEERLAAPEYVGAKFKVEVVSDDGLNVPRSAYDDSRSEKPARSALFTAVTRLMTKDTIVIVDAMNYIKGFRYQIYCAAREVGVRNCTIHVIATGDICRERNKAQPAYAEETFDNLIARYEEPNSMARWDSPLFAIPWDEELPGEAIFQCVTSGSQKPANPGVVNVAKPPTDALQSLEKVSTAIVNLIMAAQTSGASLGGPLPLDLPGSPVVNLPHRHLTLSELQRLKRQFILIHKKAVTQGMAGKADLDWSEETIARKFAVHLEENLRS